MSLVPDGIEPVIAWRRWVLRGLDQLMAIGIAEYQWQPRVAPQACCLGHHYTYTTLTFGGPTPRKHGETPSGHCMCGYWALKEMPADYGDVVGTVKLWGKLIEGEDGYRAEYAYPDQLYLIDYGQWDREPQWHREGRAKLLGAAYGVPCQLLTQAAYEQMRGLDAGGNEPEKTTKLATTSFVPMATTNAPPPATTSYAANTWLTTPQLQITAPQTAAMFTHYAEAKGDQMGEPMESDHSHDPLRRERWFLLCSGCVCLGMAVANLLLAVGRL